MAEAEKEKTERENILISVEKHFSLGEIDAACNLYSDIKHDPETREVVKKLFLKYRPAPAKCPLCGNDVQLACNFDDIYFGSSEKPFWRTPKCGVCETKKIRDTLLKNINNRMADRGIPRRFLSADMKDFPKIKDISGGCYFHGPCGTGKTHLLSAIMKDRILNAEIEMHGLSYYVPELSDHPYFISIPDLLLSIRGSFSDDETTEERIIERYSSIKTLMLDDIGTEKPTEWVLQTLYLIIDHRYRSMRETFITSNLTLDQLSERLNDRIASRIAEMCKIIRLSGEDRRIKK